MKDISSGKILYVVVGYSRVGIHRKTSTFSVAGPRTTILYVPHSCLRSLPKPQPPDPAKRALQDSRVVVSWLGECGGAGKTREAGQTLALRCVPPSKCQFKPCRECLFRNAAGNETSARRYARSIVYQQICSEFTKKRSRI